MWRTLLSITQIIFSLLLILFILIQNKGTGLSEVFGGGGSFYTSKRGIEKYLFIATIVTAILFFANSLAFIFV
jgi:protein translocase SecG subunit